MVVVSELSSIFWGVALEGGSKKYTQITERPVHISMAALDPAQQNDGPISLMFEQDGKSYVLCTLRHVSLDQQPLNLEYASGETITFFVQGKGTIHLSGYLMPEDEFPTYPGEDDDSDDDSEIEQAEDDSDDDSDEDEDVKPGKKRLQVTGSGNKSKKPKLTIDDIESEDDSDDDDFVEDEAEDSDDDDDDDDEESIEEDDDDDEDSDEDAKKDAKKKKQDKKVAKSLPKTDATKSSKPNEKSLAAVMANIVGKDNKPAGAATTVLPTTGSQKQQQQQQKANNQPQTAKPGTQQQQPVAGDAQGKKKKKKKNKKNKEANQQQAEASTSQASTTENREQLSKLATKRSLEGGVVVEDVKEGHGPEAKIGKMVRVYYTGRLPNGKIFDSTLSGNGFKFKLGKKEVITGWDVGLSGMKVGGKRKLIIPPKMGYGQQKVGQIPPNSTLIFDVELRAVN